MPKYDFGINPPYLNAAGSLGFIPGRVASGSSGPGWPKLGAFITNPLSLNPRTPSQGSRFISYPGGFLLHTGHPNPGLNAAIRRYAPGWSRSPLPVIVHILGQNPVETAQMAERLEILDNVMGIELGLPPNTSPAEARALTTAVVGETLVIVRLPYELALELAPYVIEAGAAAVSLGAPRGALPDANGSMVEGRLFGPAVYPLALQCLRAMVRLDIPTIAGGGIYTQTQAQTMLDAGAEAVQLDSVLWR